MKEIKLKIKGMMCTGCENRVKSALSLIEGVEKVEADHNTGFVTVISKEETDISEIKEKIEDIGYEIEERLKNNTGKSTWKISVNANANACLT